MQYKKPKRPGEMISKVNASKKKHHKNPMAFEMKLGNDNPKAATMPNFYRGTYKPSAMGGMKIGSAPYKGLGAGKAFKKHSGKKKTHKKNWIAGAIKHPGALHRQLGVKAGSKIPAKTLARAASKGGKLGARARLAETLKGLHKKATHSVKHKKDVKCKGC